MYMRLSGVLEDRHWLGMRDCRQSHWRKYCCNMDKRRGKEHWGLLKGQFNEEIHFQDLKQVLLTSVGLIRCLKLFAPLTVDSVPLVYMLSVEKEEKKKRMWNGSPKNYEQQQQQKIKIAGLWNKDKNADQLIRIDSTELLYMYVNCFSTKSPK